MLFILLKVGDSMGKWSKTSIVVIINIVLILFFIGFILLVNSYMQKRNIQNDTQISRRNENEFTNNLEVISTNYSGLKISPNTTIVFEKYYNKCNHKDVTQEKSNENVVNLNEEELQELYSDWIIKQFSIDRVVLYKEVEEYCGEHYILKEKDGYIGIFKIKKDGKEELIKMTNIATQYLPETDRLNIKEGLKVFSKDNLNKILEDFE